MPGSVYKVIELIGTSTTSWEEAAKKAVESAAETLRELRVAEVIEQDLVITDVVNRDGDDISLNDGDAMYFDPSAPHNYRREGRSSCSAVVVVVPDV